MQLAAPTTFYMREVCFAGAITWVSWIIRLLVNGFLFSVCGTISLLKGALSPLSSLRHRVWEWLCLANAFYYFAVLDLEAIIYGVFHVNLINHVFFLNTYNDSMR